MLENARYIQGELADVQMDDGLRARTEEVCSGLVGTRFDVVSELSELDELLASGAPDSTIRQRVDRIVRWLLDDVTRMHRLVEALEAAGQADPACTLAYVLVAESATNVLDAFARTRRAADSLRPSEPGGEPSTD